MRAPASEVGGFARAAPLGGGLLWLRGVLVDDWVGP